MARSKFDLKESDELIKSQELKVSRLGLAFIVLPHLILDKSFHVLTLPAACDSATDRSASAAGYSLLPTGWLVRGGPFDL
jgi:hypothetical protein